MLSREYKELEVKMQETFQKRVEGLQEQVGLLQQRCGLDVCEVWYFTNHCKLEAVVIASACRLKAVCSS